MVRPRSVAGVSIHHADVDSKVPAGRADRSRGGAAARGRQGGIGARHRGLAWPKELFPPLQGSDRYDASPVPRRLDGHEALHRGSAVSCVSGIIATKPLPWLPPLGGSARQPHPSGYSRKLRGRHLRLKTRRDGFRIHPALPSSIARLKLVSRTPRYGVALTSSAWHRSRPARLTSPVNTDWVPHPPDPNSSCHHHRASTVRGLPRTGPDPNRPDRSSTSHRHRASIARPDSGMNGGA